MTAFDPIRLFRAEVAQSRKERLHGEVILTHPLRAQVLTGLLVLIVGLVAAWIVLGTYTRNETVRGILVTDQPSTKIVALRPGLITQLLIREGDRVRAGQRLATVLVEQRDETGGSATAESLQALDAQRALSERQAELAVERAGAERASLRASLSGLHTQRSDIAAQIHLQEQVVGSVREMFARMAPVMERGFVSQIEFERRRQALLSAQQQLVQLRQQWNALAAEERRTVAELARTAADEASAVATAETSVHSYTQQRAQAMAGGAYAIEAPISGRVAALQTAIGRTADPATPLMTIVPDRSALHAEVYAPTRAVGFVKPGQEVRLLYDAFAYQRFGSFAGRVTRVSRTAIDPRDLAAAVKLEEPVYRIEIALERQSVEAFGANLALQPGMTLDANLILDRRTFADWLLQPLNAVLRRSQ